MEYSATNQAKKQSNKNKENDQTSQEKVLPYVRPKFLGMDYIKAIYFGCSILGVMMVIVYFTIENEKV